MINKTLHYCWFGKNEFPEIVKKCIASWHEYLPNYEIKFWNEDNYDVNKNDYIKGAYESKKYAFVSDFARFDILHQYGGVYVDTDVEVIRPLDDFLKNKMFTGFEQISTVAPGLILGSESNTDLFKQIIQYYSNEKFILSDGSYNLQTVVSIMTNLLKSKGLLLNGQFQIIDDMAVYPIDFFSPKVYNTGKLILTNNTYTIHHNAGSWLSKKDKLKIWAYKVLNSIFGTDIFAKIRNVFKN